MAAPKLRKAQREALLSWIAEGLGTTEINERAGAFHDPFEASTQLVDYYRRRNGIEIQRLITAGEQRAMLSGLGKKAERVDTLKQLAEKLKADLLEEDLLWLDRVKSIGSGDYQQVIPYREFNQAEVESLRGVLDDIAKELGDRKQQTDHLLKMVDFSRLTPEQLDRIAEGEDPLRVVLGG